MFTHDGRRGKRGKNAAAASGPEKSSSCIKFPRGQQVEAFFSCQSDLDLVKFEFEAFLKGLGDFLFAFDDQDVQKGDLGPTRMLSLARRFRH